MHHPNALVHELITALVCVGIGLVGMQIVGIRVPFSVSSIVRAVGRSLVFLFVTVPTWLFRGMGAHWGDSARALRCTNGCGRELPMLAIMTCSGCGYRSRRPPFSPCRMCGLALRHYRCPWCRMSITRPALWTQPQPPRRYR
jgi:hypothetical protein